MSFDMFPDAAIKYLLEHEGEPVPVPSENYTRQTGPNGEEIGMLGVECGSHCGVITVGSAHQRIGHCGKPCCHDNPEADAQITRLLNKPEGVDPRGII